MTEDQITAEAISLLEKDGRYHAHQSGGVYSVRLSWRPSLALVADDTAALREKIEEAIRQRESRKK